MATGTVIFPIRGADLDGTNPPELVTENSVSFLLFDDTTKELIYFAFRIPATFDSVPILKIQYEMISATADDIQFGVDVQKSTPGSADDLGIEDYDAANTNTDTVPSSAGYPAEVSITMTNYDCFVAGDYAVFRMYRDAADAADTATGDMGVRSLTMEFTTA